MDGNIITSWKILYFETNTSIICERLGTTDFLSYLWHLSFNILPTNIIFQIYLDLDIQHCFLSFWHHLVSTIYHRPSVLFSHSKSHTALKYLGLNFLGWLLRQGLCPLCNCYIAIDGALFIVKKNKQNPHVVTVKPGALLVSVWDSVLVMTDRNISSPAKQASICSMSSKFSISRQIYDLCRYWRSSSSSYHMLTN